MLYVWYLRGWVLLDGATNRVAARQLASTGAFEVVGTLLRPCEDEQVPMHALAVRLRKKGDTSACQDGLCIASAKQPRHARGIARVIGA